MKQKKVKKYSLNWIKNHLILLNGKVYFLAQPVGKKIKILLPATFETGDIFTFNDGKRKIVIEPYELMNLRGKLE
jgi:hypothetical protein